MSLCQFGAIEYNHSLKRITIDHERCFGCGVCRHACKHEALHLIPRDEFPGFDGEY